MSKRSRIAVAATGGLVIILTLAGLASYLSGDPFWGGVALGAVSILSAGLLIAGTFATMNWIYRGN